MLKLILKTKTVKFRTETTIRTLKIASWDVPKIKSQVSRTPSLLRSIGESICSLFVVIINGSSHKKVYVFVEGVEFVGTILLPCSQFCDEAAHEMS